jgi:hypothetical protein
MNMGEKMNRPAKPSVELNFKLDKPQMNIDFRHGSSAMGHLLVQTTLRGDN